ncbi:response regulator [Candidatus Woesearchaeota archaeon]|nr:response regulator [Candidatus Woesearchaeota archaeon]
MKSQNKKRVMVIDDEYTIRELVELSLDPDYKVIKAATGLEAIEILKQSKPDLIILDIMMPKMNGFEVCSTIKKDDDFKDIPVIMLTAKHGIDDVKQAIKADCDEYITKPFEPELIKKRVDAYLGDGPAEKDTERRLFQFGKSLHYIKERKNMPS